MRREKFCMLLPLQSTNAEINQAMCACACQSRNKSFADQVVYHLRYSVVKNRNERQT